MASRTKSTGMDGVDPMDRGVGWERRRGEMERRDGGVGWGRRGTRWTAGIGDQRIRYFRMVSRMRASSLVDSLRASRSSSIWLRLKMASELVFIRDSNFRLHTA